MLQQTHQEKADSFASMCLPMFGITFIFLLQLVILVNSCSVVVSLGISVNSLFCPEFEVFFHEYILGLF
jgi:hypothetical protein